MLGAPGKWAELHSFPVGPGRRLVDMVLFIPKMWGVSKALKAPLVG